MRDEIISYVYLSKWARATGNADSGLLYTKQALAKVLSLGVASIRAMVYKELFATFKQLHNQDSAFAYLQLAKSLDDSLHNAKMAKTNQYQRLNLADQINSQEKEKAAIQSASLTRTYLFLAGIGVLAAVAFYCIKTIASERKPMPFYKTHWQS